MNHRNSRKPNVSKDHSLQIKNSHDVVFWIITAMKSIVSFVIWNLEEYEEVLKLKKIAVTIEIVGCLHCCLCYFDWKSD